MSAASSSVAGIEELWLSENEDKMLLLLLLLMLLLLLLLLV